MLLYIFGNSIDSLIVFIGVAVNDNPLRNRYRDSKSLRLVGVKLKEIIIEGNHLIRIFLCLFLKLV